MLAAVAVALVAAAYWYQTARQPAAVSKHAKAAPAVPVTAAKATVRDMPILLEVPGRAEAYASVTLKSRLDGQVTAVLYSEGQRVSHGDVLVRLDPGDFDARLQQAEANLARNESQLAKARADVERYVARQRCGFVPEENANQLRTPEAAPAAVVKAGSGVVTQGLADSAGVSETTARDTLVLREGDLAALEQAFFVHGPQIAAAIVERLEANNGLVVQTRQWLQELRSITEKQG